MHAMGCIQEQLLAALVQLIIGLVESVADCGSEIVKGIKVDSSEVLLRCVRVLWWSIAFFKARWSFLPSRQLGCGDVSFFGLFVCSFQKTLNSSSFRIFSSTVRVSCTVSWASAADS
jgi:hypothetical protein